MPRTRSLKKTGEADSAEAIATAPDEEGCLTIAIDDLDGEGFTEHFDVRDGCLVGLDSGGHFTPSEVVIREVRRFEGVSDPDDMSITYAIETRSGVRGTLTDAFGVYSNPAVSEFVRTVESQPEGAGGQVEGRNG